MSQAQGETRYSNLEDREQNFKVTMSQKQHLKM